LVGPFALLNHFGYDNVLARGIGIVGLFVALVQFTFADDGID